MTNSWNFRNSESIRFRLYSSHDINNSLLYSEINEDGSRIHQERKDKINSITKCINNRNNKALVGEIDELISEY